MDPYVKKLSKEFDYLDEYHDYSKLVVLGVVVLFAALPLTIIAILTLASFSATAAGF